MTVNHQMWHVAPGVVVLHSCYRRTAAGVVRGSEGALLIDPGLFPVELAALDELAWRWGGAQQIVLTHSHWDRLLGVTSFPQAERIAHAHFMSCYLSEEAARRTDGKPSTPEFVRDLDRAYGIERPPLQMLPPTHTFEHSYTLDLGDSPVQIFHTPGHTADSITVLLPDEGVLFVGDMLSDREPLTIDDSAAYLHSLDLIQQLVADGKIHTVVPGHGRVLRGAYEINALIAADRSYILGVHDQLIGAMRQHYPPHIALPLLERAVGE